MTEPSDRPVKWQLNCAGLRAFVKGAFGGIVEWMKYKVRVDMHMPGGFTKLRWHAGGDLYFDVPTDSIPQHLRSIGSTVLLRIRVGAELTGGGRSSQAESVIVEEFPRSSAHE